VLFRSIPLLFIVIEIQLTHLLSELLMGTSICDDGLIPIDPCFIRELFGECIAYFLEDLVIASVRIESGDTLV
jgi:hypothetical protein